MSRIATEKPLPTASTLRQIVHGQIAAGILPRATAHGLVAAYGNGAPCDVCAQPTSPASVAYKMRLGIGADARTACMHASCFEVWDEIRKHLPEESSCEPQPADAAINKEPA